MPAQKKTKNLQLNQWTSNEYPKMIDFNEDNLKLDTEIGKIKESLKSLDYVDKVELQGNEIIVTKKGQQTRIPIPKGFSGNWEDLTNKPDLLKADWSKITGKPTYFPTNWSNISNKPDLVTDTEFERFKTENDRKINTKADIVDTGYKSRLLTTNKNNLVEAINEVFQLGVDKSQNIIDKLNALLNTKTKTIGDLEKELKKYEIQEVNVPLSNIKPPLMSGDAYAKHNIFQIFHLENKIIFILKKNIGFETEDRISYFDLKENTLNTINISNLSDFSNMDTSREYAYISRNDNIILIDFKNLTKNRIKVNGSGAFGNIIKFNNKFIYITNYNITNLKTKKTIKFSDYNFIGIFKNYLAFKKSSNENKIYLYTENGLAKTISLEKYDKDWIFPQFFFTTEKNIIVNANNTSQNHDYYFYDENGKLIKTKKINYEHLRINFFDNFNYKTITLYKKGDSFFYGEFDGNLEIKNKLNMNGIVKNLRTDIYSNLSVFVLNKNIVRVNFDESKHNDVDIFEVKNFLEKRRIKK